MESPCLVHKLPEEVLDHIFFLCEGYEGEIFPTITKQRCFPSSTYIWPALHHISATCRRWYNSIHGRQHHQFRYISYGVNLPNAETSDEPHLQSDLAKWDQLLESEEGKRTRLVVAIRLVEKRHLFLFLLVFLERRDRAGGAGSRTQAIHVARAPMTKR